MQNNLKVKQYSPELTYMYSWRYMILSLALNIWNRFQNLNYVILIILNNKTTESKLSGACSVTVAYSRIELSKLPINTDSRPEHPPENGC